MNVGRLNERPARAAIELVAVVVLVTVDLWLAWDRPWLLALVRTLAAAVLIVSFLRRRAGWPPEGGKGNMTAGRAWLEAAAVTLILGVAVHAWAAAISGPFDEPDLTLLRASVPALGLWLLRHLALAFIQQLALQLFLWPVGREVLGRDLPAVVAVAVLFGLGHLPSWPFAIATAIAATLWISLYRGSGRLAPLIASHVLLAALASTLPDRLFYDMKVGAPALEIAADQRSLASEEKQALLKAFTSPSYAAYRGGSDSGYVAGLYRDVLGRVADDHEVAYGVEQLASSHPEGGQTKLSRLALAKRMLLSEELDDGTLWRRFIDDQPLAPGLEITPSSDQARFTGWYDAEGEWRWARDSAPTVDFHFDREPERDHVLTVSGGAAVALTVELELNGRIIDSSRFFDFAPRDYRFLLNAEHLGPGGNNTLRFLVSGTPVVLDGDPRALGFGLRRLRLAPLRLPSAAVLFDEDDYFLRGFSVAEERLRWTLEPVARLFYPLREVVPDGCYNLRLEAGAFERQEVRLEVKGRQVAEWTLDGLEPQIQTARLDAEQLSTGPNLVDFHLPEAKRPEGDPRRLGLAFISLRIYPLKDCS